MTESLRKLDIRHLWHPYTDISSMEKRAFPIIERAEGVYLYDTDGRPILDGISSWWACALGHGHPRVVEAIREQAGRLQHSILGGMSHPGAIRLAEDICELTPPGLDHVFFASDGASAVEAALKIAIQYRANLGQDGRSSFISLADGYHGDTLGAVGVGFLPHFHSAFAGAVRQSYRAESPYCLRCPAGRSPGDCKLECFQSMERLIRKHHQSVAAVIVEPLCQAAAGVRIYPADYLRRLRALCDEYGLLLIADEIAVGFGRTGAMFACDKAGISPDIMCLGKALTAGYLPMSATVVSDRIYDSFRSDGGRDRAFYHGHTFCGNPIAAAAARAALAECRERNIVQRIQPLVEKLRAGMSSFEELDCVRGVRTLGMIGMMELQGKASAPRVASRALELGLFIRPLGAAVYLWPPLVTTKQELERMLSILSQAVAEAPLPR